MTDEEKEFHLPETGQVLTCNEVPLDDQLAQLQKDLQQEEELARLHAQVPSNPCSATPPGVSLSKDIPTNNATENPQMILLDTVQRLIIEEVRAHLMQSQYCMRPRYMKPYPAEIDMYPFLRTTNNHIFLSLMGTRSPYEHIDHFLVSCQDSTHNAALLLMQEAFLQRFCSTQRMVGTTKLTRTEQAHNVRVANFIN